ncbi:MarR family winged helix-turn-helix transcriptional regulator [Nocardioides sp. zg-DK7169]|uniref:MarR family winged helix-turn-helix transcriptional regulator n=1 Tax=Nocardioides sp. zg-DK7169 TaxID=2736600 RepID=UPI0015530FC9|nr:MarR family transcriptional regulator [Nocardioides sp. zg-DK7169]NPC98902.1 MarR family transcriptional regulator [Nocardioides sp. zg-DK7169]
MTAKSRHDALQTVEREIGVMMRRIRKVTGVRARMIDPHLQAASYLMLGHLVQYGPMRSSSLAEVFNIDKGAISRQVQHLVDLGLVVRTPDPEDGRATLVEATEDAARRVRAVAAERLEWWDERLGEWSDEELAGFADVLTRYNAILSEPQEPGSTPHGPGAGPA